MGNSIIFEFETRTRVRFLNHWSQTLQKPTVVVTHTERQRMCKFRAHKRNGMYERLSYQRICHQLGGQLAKVWRHTADVASLTNLWPWVWSSDWPLESDWGFSSRVLPRWPSDANKKKKSNFHSMDLQCGISHWPQEVFFQSTQSLCVRTHLVLTHQLCPPSIKILFMGYWQSGINLAFRKQK